MCIQRDGKANSGVEVLHKYVGLSLCSIVHFIKPGECSHIVPSADPTQVSSRTSS